MRVSKCLKGAPMKRLKILTIMWVTVWVFGFSISAVKADIYSWTDEDGVSHFTNYAPPKQARLLMKTPEIPYDEEADIQRREAERLEMARQELAEREAFLLQQQQEAQRRIAEANARAEAALREADRILKDVETAADEADSYRSSSYRSGYYYPYYGIGPRHFFKGQRHFHGNLFHKKHHFKTKRHHFKPKRHHLKHRHPGKHFTKRSFHHRFVRKHGIRRHHSITRGRFSSHHSRAAAFRGRHGRF
jgi:hypothetical protein